MFNLREEGLQDFRARINSDKVDINMKGIRKYNKLLEKLSKKIYKAKAEEFHYYKISTFNLTPSGEYANGRYMCTTIALSTAKRMRDQKSINRFPLIFGKNKDDVYTLDQLNDAFSRNKLIYISDMPKEVIEATIKQIEPLPHYYFLRLYEKACDDLGIEDKNRVMTGRRFYKLANEAIEYGKKIRRDKLRSARFADTT